ncbi:MAG: putative CRISPR-associated protein [Candidatus Omnitrophica bacterium]|nr:putative CRISPR-associated protein [Candidatus Omnitrophota bacterium]
MKKVITMVGTSIFENYFEKNDDKTIKKYYDVLKEKREKDWDNDKNRRESVEKAIIKWIQSESNKKNISAEIKSLAKLQEELKENFDIYLLCSDTILSRLAGQIIKDVLLQLFNNRRIETKVIGGLQIWDRKEFNAGMSNLISEIYSIADGYWDNVIINITGGYKATIPYLTILAQINRCPIYYIFEDTDALIKIPNIPFSTEWFDWKTLEKYESYLIKLDQGIIDKSEVQKLLNSDFYEKYSFLVWTEGDLAELNPIGRIIFNKYNEQFVKFFATDEVFALIEKDENLKKLLQNQFANKMQRESKTEIKKGHYVYDAGDNQLRIFYRESKGNIYIYNAFNEHKKYEQYLNSTPFSENIIKMQEFKERKIKKEV